jgi:hypothetical protein
MAKRNWWFAGRQWTIALAGWLVLVACGDDPKPPPQQQQPAACTPATDTGCPTGQVCEEVVGGQPACFAPVTLQGKVVSTTGTPIEGATVVARDANGAAVSSVGVTKADGSYSLTVSAPRNADGSINANVLYTLRADATGYQTFPTPPREALPVDMTEATGDPLVVHTTATDISLIPLASATGLGTIQGKVVADNPGGTLVVAGVAPTAVTAVADVNGDFTIFNVPAGTVQVKGYKTGIELASATTTVAAGGTQTGVTLQSTGPATATVSGTVQIVNAPGGSKTSVILVVEDTFNPTVIHGEAPPGLRVGNVSGTWSIAQVPTGVYIALAAFENDHLVRDPDTSIGGTAIQRVTVTGANVTVPGFKITEALDVVSPGANGAEAVSGNPTFTWVDDSSEDYYDVKVFDALGTLVWESPQVVGPNGNANATVTYAGPALVSGMYYQFRAVSIKDGVPISSTEDLKGVFYAQ